jgi:mono/diheme cytochrome c family protein
VQAIATALGTSSTSPPPSTTPPATTDGATLYGTSCAGCHGPLATSAKAGRSATQIQTAINSNTGGMGSLSTLSATQVQAIATALVSSTPAPAPACGSCHAIPPSSGHHSTHRSRSCATCHGTGYSTTTVNAATHNNGVKNIVSTIGWNATNRSCSNSCHGTHSW